MVMFRPARENDLRQARAVYYANQLLENPRTPPPPETPPAMLEHILRTGTLYVAEEQGQVIAFAGAITRGHISFLTDLFVQPEQQSTHLGQTLLQQVMPPTEDGIRCTLSSSDPRALALYIRSGMRPQWPHFSLTLADTTHLKLPASELTISIARAGDPELLAWDRMVSGRERPQDHAYWINAQQALPLWFQRAGKLVGYGYVRPGAHIASHPTACSLGPIGALAPGDAADCVLAAVDYARQVASVLHIEVPGPHPCLTPLLEARFQIEYADTYMTSAPTAFFDPACYLASGSDLF